MTGNKLNLHGGGYSKRAFIHISDVVKATYNIAVQANLGSSWHISTNEALSIRSIVNLICEILKTPFDSIVIDEEERLGKDANYLLDSSKLRNHFNWKPEIGLEKGIKETINWVGENLDELKDLPWSYTHKK